MNARYIPKVLPELRHAPLQQIESYLLMAQAAIDSAADIMDTHEAQLGLDEEAYTDLKRLVCDDLHFGALKARGYVEGVM